VKVLVDLQALKYNNANQNRTSIDLIVACIYIYPQIAKACFDGKIMILDTTCSISNGI